MTRALETWRPYALLVLLCLGLYVPGMVRLPVTDRDEARFVQATRQMLETHDFVVIRFQDEARNKKPAGIYWLQAAAVALTSTADSNAIWPYRLPSLLGAMAASLATFAMGARLVGRKAAFLGAALLASSVGVVTEAHLAKTDAVLLGCVAIAQLALARLYLDAREAKPASAGAAYGFWIALALGVLVKGPVAPLVAALTLVALAIADRSGAWLKSLRPVSGLLLLAAIVLPWLVLISTATGGAFLSNSIGHDFLGKLIGAQESHGAPPLYYLVLLAATFWPAILFFGPTLAFAWRERRGAAERFLIAWAVPFWIVLELVPTKLPNYLLPAYPALALMMGRALVAIAENGFATRRDLDRTVAAIWTLTALGLAGVLVVAPIDFGGDAAAGIVAAAIVLFFGARMTLVAWRGPTPGLAARAVVLALLVFPLSFEFVAPSLTRLWLSRDAAALVASAAPPNDKPVAVAGYAEPSIVFLLGTRTMLVGADSAARYLTATRGALALVERRSDEVFQKSLAAMGWQPHVLGKVQGLDYSNGHGTTLTLYSAAPR